MKLFFINYFMNILTITVMGAVIASNPVHVIIQILCFTLGFICTAFNIAALSDKVGFK